MNLQRGGENKRYPILGTMSQKSQVYQLIGWHKYGTLQRSLKQLTSPTDPPHTILPTTELL